MWIALVIAGAFFVAMLAMGYFACKDLGSEERPERAAPEAHAGACAVCEGGLPARPTTSDQVVFEVEHRIDAELRDIAHALHAHPERLGRMFHA